MSRIKNDPSSYRSRADIAGKTKSNPPEPLPTKEQRQRLKGATIDSRWYIQFPPKVR